MKLLKRYHAHINVEVAASVNTVGYLFKYIIQGSETAAVQVVVNCQPHGNEAADLKDFLNVKYTSSTEAVCEFLGDHRQRITPDFEQLPVTLPGQEFIVVDADKPDVHEAGDSMMSKMQQYMARPLNFSGRVGDDAPAADNLPFHQQDEDAQRQEEALLKAYLDDTQADAVLRNDFDAMTYCTFHEHNRMMQVERNAQPPPDA